MYRENHIVTVPKNLLPTAEEIRSVKNALIINLNQNINSELDNILSEIHEMILKEDHLYKIYYQFKYSKSDYFKSENTKFILINALNSKLIELGYYTYLSSDLIVIDWSKSNAPKKKEPSFFNKLFDSFKQFISLFRRKVFVLVGKND